MRTARWVTVAFTVHNKDVGKWFYRQVEEFIYTLEMYKVPQKAMTRILRPYWSVMKSEAIWAQWHFEQFWGNLKLRDGPVLPMTPVIPRDLCNPPWPLWLNLYVKHIDRCSVFLTVVDFTIVCWSYVNVLEITFLEPFKCLLFRILYRLAHVI